MSLATFLHRIQKGLSKVELIHVPHPRWPLPPPSSPIAPTLHISVLDSSFNPPTLAHLSLSSLLPPTHTAAAPPPRTSAPAPPDFDARLLLLSVRNADKQLKPGDATYEQRMAMMVLLAQDLARTSSSPSPAPTRDPNVAVAIIDEPTFVGKSSLLLDFLRARVASLASDPEGHPAPIVSTPSPAAPPTPKLTFVMGTDTIVRFFAARYYADRESMVAALRRFLSPQEDDSRIVCARRTSRGASAGEEEALEVQLPDFVGEFTALDHDRIGFVDIGEKECVYSSSEVREKVALGDATWRSMVTESVAKYVDDHRLYVPQ